MVAAAHSWRIFRWIKPNFYQYLTLDVPKAIGRRNAVPLANVIGTGHLIWVLLLTVLLIHQHHIFREASGPCPSSMPQLDRNDLAVMTPVLYRREMLESR